MKPKGNLKVREKSEGSRETLFLCEVCTDILSRSIFLQGVDQKILPCGQGGIDSVKIDPSLSMMREC